MTRLTAHRIHKHNSKIPGWRGERLVDAIDAWSAASLARFEALNKMRHDETIDEAGQWAAEIAVTLSEDYRRRMVAANRWSLAWSILFTLQCVAAMGILWLVGR